MSTPNAHVAAFSGKLAVVIGDVMLDETLSGDVRRISPEAPVPVLEIRTRDQRLGGAANTAANIRALGGRAHVIGLVGNDPGAAAVTELLHQEQLGAYLVIDPSRPTTRKTRLIARGQQMARVDEESTAPPSLAVREALQANVTRCIEEADVCVISDYAKGVVDRALCGFVIALATAKGIPVVVDPKQRDFSVYRGATVLTPNLRELEEAANRPLPTNDAVHAAATELLTTLGGAALLATRGADGMTLFRPSRSPEHVRAIAKEVFDVTGAGDSVVATLALALAVDVPLEEAIKLASAAASVVVSKRGTAVVSPRELDAALALL